jgi:hypothetical protein
MREPTPRGQWEKAETWALRPEQRKYAGFLAGHPRVAYCLLLLRFELRPIVEIHHALITDMHDHVNLAIAVDVPKFQGDGYRAPII